MNGENYCHSNVIFLLLLRCDYGDRTSICPRSETVLLLFRPLAVLPMTAAAVTNAAVAVLWSEIITLLLQLRNCLNNSSICFIFCSLPACSALQFRNLFFSDFFYVRRSSEVFLQFIPLLHGARGRFGKIADGSQSPGETIFFFHRCLWH